MKPVPMTWKQALKMRKRKDKPILMKIVDMKCNIQGIKKGDVIELIRIEKKKFTLDLANQTGMDPEPLQFPLHHQMRFKVAMRRPREYVYETVQELIDDYPAVTKLVSAQQPFMHGDAQVNVNEKLEIRGKTSNEDGIELLDVFSNIKELPMLLPGDFDIKFQQCPKLPREEFQNDHPEGYTAATILEKWELGDKYHRVKIVRKELAPNEIPHNWVNETLQLCCLHSCVVMNKMSAMSTNYDIPENLEIKVQLVTTSLGGPKISLDEIAQNPPTYGCRLTVDVEKPIDTILRQKRIVSNNSELSVHKFQKTNKVLFESRDFSGTHNYAVKTTYGGKFTRTPIRFETVRDLAYHVQQGSSCNATYRICKTDTETAKGTGLSNPMEGDIIQIIELTNQSQGHKHVQVLKCIREAESDPRANTAYYPMEAKGDFEKIENNVVMTINDVANLPYGIEIKVHEKDNTLAYDPLEHCASLRVKANFTEHSVIACILNYDGNITHPDAFEFPIRRDLITVKKQEDYSSKMSLEHIRVICLPVVDRITKKHAQNLQINETQRIPVHRAQHAGANRRGSRLPLSDELLQLKLTQRRTSTPDLFHLQSRQETRALPTEIQHEIQRYGRIRYNSDLLSSALSGISVENDPRPALPPRPPKHDQQSPLVPPRTLSSSPRHGLTSSFERQQNLYTAHPEPVNYQRNRTATENVYSRETGNTARPFRLSTTTISSISFPRRPRKLNRVPEHHSMPNLAGELSDRFSAEQNQNYFKRRDNSEVFEDVDSQYSSLRSESQSSYESTGSRNSSMSHLDANNTGGMECLTEDGEEFFYDPNYNLPRR